MTDLDKYTPVTKCLGCLKVPCASERLWAGAVCNQRHKKPTKRPWAPLKQSPWPLLKMPGAHWGRWELLSLPGNNPDCAGSRTGPVQGAWGSDTARDCCHPQHPQLTGGNQAGGSGQHREWKMWGSTSATLADLTPLQNLTPG